MRRTGQKRGGSQNGVGSREYTMWRATLASRKKWKIRVFSKNSQTLKAQKLHSGIFNKNPNDFPRTGSYGQTGDE